VREVALRKAINAADVIKVLGGSEKVAALCRVKKTSVYQWTYKKKFPARYAIPMTAALKKRHHIADPALWGIPV
jgi:hypothetical protein